MKHEISNRLVKVDNKALFGDPRAESLISTQRRLLSPVDFPRLKGLKHFHLLQITPIQSQSSFSGAYPIRETCAKLAPFLPSRIFLPKIAFKVYFIEILHRERGKSKKHLISQHGFLRCRSTLFYPELDTFETSHYPRILTQYLR